MAEEPKERKAFEAHMRVGGYSNHDKHPDGSYVSSAMELWWQGWKARAQLPSQGGEAVAYRFRERPDDMRSSWLYVKKRAQVPQGHQCQPLYTHPAEQVAKGVVVSRELLERAVYNMDIAEMDGPTCRELRAMLEVKL